MAKKKTNIIIPIKKKTLKVLLRETQEQYVASEKRNIAAIEYIQIMEKVFKEILYFSAEHHEKLNLVISPGTEEAILILAKVCAHVVPFCSDVDEIKLPPEAVAELYQQGARMVEQPEEDPDKPETPEEEKDVEAED